MIIISNWYDSMMDSSIKDIKNDTVHFAYIQIIKLLINKDFLDVVTANLHM